MSESSIQEDFVMTEKVESSITPLIDIKGLKSVDLGPGDILIASVTTGKLSAAQADKYFIRIADAIRDVLNAAGHTDVEVMVVPNTTEFSVLKMAENPIV